jgi:hypothetical protein
MGVEFFQVVDPLLDTDIPYRDPEFLRIPTMIPPLTVPSSLIMVIPVTQMASF